MAAQLVLIMDDFNFHIWSSDMPSEQFLDLI